MFEDDNNFNTSVVVIGVKKVDFTNKENELVQGVSIMYAVADSNNDNLVGLAIDKSNCSVWLKGLDRFNEFTMLKPPYTAKITSKNVGLGKTPRFVDIKIS